MDTLPVIVLLVVQLILGVCSAVPSRSKRLENTRIDECQGASTARNLTVDCGDIAVLLKTISQCQRGFINLTSFGFPWSLNASQRYGDGNDVKVTGRVNNLRDALDSLNYVCHIHDLSRGCMKQRGIEDFCLDTTVFSRIQFDFQYICYHRQRNEIFVRSLQCLRETRTLVMLYFHIAHRCRGVLILDDIAAGNKNAYFYTLDIQPYFEQTVVPLLYCLPKSAIYSCIREVVADQCGTMTADLVQGYLVYLQNRHGKALQSAGLVSNICDQGIRFSIVPQSRQSIPSGYAKLNIFRLLGITAPGTALDTVAGKHTLAYLKGLSGKELCTTFNAHVAYEACVMSSVRKSGKSKFNILQFAHQIIPFAFQGTYCSRLGSFKWCWNQLQQICGPKVRGLKHHATLLVEGCKIQSELDTAGCLWQDMLLPCYIQASRVTVWPMINQCLLNRIYLENGHYTNFNSILADLDTVIALLQPGVEEISRKCGPQPGKQLSLLLSKLRYLQRDALKYSLLVANTSQVISA